MERQYKLSVLTFNSVEINGELIEPKYFVYGSCIIEEIGEDKAVTTVDHIIHNARIALHCLAHFTLYGNREDLSTQKTETDLDNFGGLHKFYQDGEEIVSFRGLVTATYSEKTRRTTVEIKGEVNG